MFGVLIRNKDLLFPDVRNRPSDSGAFENALWSPFVRDNYKKDIVFDRLRAPRISPQEALGNLIEAYNNL